MKLVAGNSNRPLSEAIGAYLKTPLTKCIVRRFADMEIFVEILENVRGEDVFVIQSTSAPANDHLMELLILIDALRRASARRITAVIPYFGYARQDRKPGPRTPISAKLVANMVDRAGADRVLTLDLADDVHHFRFAGALAPFVDDGKWRIDALGDAASSHHAANIGRHHHQIVRAEILADVLHHHRGGEEIVGWDVEEALDLPGMQIQRHHTVGAGAGDQVGDQLGRNRRA